MNPNTCPVPGCLRWKPVQLPLCDLHLEWCQRFRARILLTVALVIPAGVAVLTWLMVKEGK